MARVSRSERVAQLYDAQKVDKDDTIAALRLQAKAWRILALLATDNPARSVQQAKWLLMQTVPWVNGDALQSFIAENEAEAAEAGKRSGVFV